jgi:hypothetical protein
MTENRCFAAIPDQVNKSTEILAIMCLEENLNIEDKELEDLDEEQLQALIGGGSIFNDKGEIIGQTSYGVVRPPLDDHLPPDNHNPHPQPIPLPYPKPFPRPRPHPFPIYLH